MESGGKNGENWLHDIFDERLVSPLEILYDIFGSNRVHDYSAPNKLNMDYNNFSDPSHFDLHTGYIMLEEIYGDMGNIKNK